MGGKYPKTVRARNSGPFSRSIHIDIFESIWLTVVDVWTEAILFTNSLLGTIIQDSK